MAGKAAVAVLHLSRLPLTVAGAGDDGRCRWKSAAGRCEWKVRVALRDTRMEYCLPHFVAVLQNRGWLAGMWERVESIERWK